MVLVDSLEIRVIGMDFEPYFKVYNLVSVHPKSTINFCMYFMVDLSMIFHVVVSVYRSIKI